MSIAVTIFIEQIPVKYRKYTSLLNIAWCIGGALSSFFAFLIAKFNFLSFEAWTIQMVICAFLSFVLSILRMRTLESPIYLYEIQDRKVYDVMLAIAKKNSNENYTAEFPLLRKETSVFNANDSIFSKTHIHTTLYLLIIYFFSSLAYYCLLYFMPVLIPIESEETVYYIICLQQLRNL
jgi:MFS family permease